MGLQRTFDILGPLEWMSTDNFHTWCIEESVMGFVVLQGNRHLIG